MVILADTASRPPESSSAAPAEAPMDVRRDASVQGHGLRNISFPGWKTWGNHRMLGFMGGVNGKSDVDGGRIRRAAVDGGEDAGLEEIREKLLVHLREAADRMNLAVPSTLAASPDVVDRDAEAAPETEDSSASALPWKLRVRRGCTKPRVMGGGDGVVAGDRTASSSSPPPAAAEKRSTRRRPEKSPPRAKFSIALTREEIDEDIYAVTGVRARRRPRKRPRVVQKQLDLLFPGSWLSEITAESYKVPE